MIKQPVPTRKIHLIFKTHLDVGFTDFSSKVVENYFQHYIPAAINLAQRLRLAGSPDRFVWTTGSWLIYEYLDQASPKERKIMETAIAAGDIAWHGLPFTTHSELMDASLFRFGLSLSQSLDRRFGRRTLAAKMTDVPGHTRAIVPRLAEAGIEFLHIGVNAASTPPDVPPVFIWRDPSGAEVMVMYHKGSYGELMLVPGLADAISFAHTGDNLGPQSEEALHAAYQAIRGQFTGVEVAASTLDAFAVELGKIRQTLPVVTAEIGDTWIHGAGTDPYKVARYRQLLRWRRQRLEAGDNPDSLDAFSRRLLLVPEHTWGLDIKTHLGDFAAYSAVDFRAARAQPGFKKVEASWAEQRNYITQAVEALPDEASRAQARQALEEIIPRLLDTRGYEPIQNLSEPVKTGHFEVRIDPDSGALVQLSQKSNLRQWASINNPLGVFYYEAFSTEDYARYYRDYVKNKRETWEWSVPDFTKPGLGDAARLHMHFTPRLKQAWIKPGEKPGQLLLEMEMPEVGWKRYGCPRQVWINYLFPENESAVHIALQWFDKPASRLPEALWFSFNPRIPSPKLWRLDKIGEWISPLEVIRDGNRHLHAVGQGISYEDQAGRLSIESLDAPLVAPGRPSLLHFTNRQPVLREGMHFNLYNNIWGTNFPMWYEDPALFRFILHTVE